MMLLAAALLAGSPPHHGPPVVQARATVRILSGARLKFGGKPDPQLPRPRNTIIITNGAAQTARLIEFE